LPEAGDVARDRPADAGRLGLDVVAPGAAAHGVEELAEVVAGTPGLRVRPEGGDEVVARHPVAADREQGGQLGRLPRRQEHVAVGAASARHAEEGQRVFHAA